MTRKLPLARDRSVGCYFWTLGVYCACSKHTHKIFSVDLGYGRYIDAYGTFEELQLLNDTIGR